MKFIDFDRKFSRYLLGESIAVMFPKVFFDDNLPAVKSLVSFGDYIVTSSERANLDSLSKEKRLGAENPQLVKEMALLSILDVVISTKNIVNLKTANAIILKADSFNRPKIILKLHDCMKERAWVHCFFRTWSSFDGCSLYTEEFKEKLEKFNSETVMKQFFNKDEYQNWLDSEDEICVYRGAFETFKCGLSWTTDIEVARKFANTYIDMKSFGFSYYRAKCQMSPDDFERLSDNFSEEVSIFSMVVKKKDCIFIEDRKENEVFVINSDQYEIETLI